MPSRRLTDDEMDDLIAQFVRDGGEVIRLRSATKKDQEKASRRWYHEDKAIAGSTRSKDALARESAREKTMIFSRDERWKAEE
jgi:hypothetical protein